MTTAAGLGAAALTQLGQSSPVQAANAVDPASMAVHAVAFAGSQAEFRSAFESILLHENEHVFFLLEALGSKARPKPTFQNLTQTNVVNFVNLARNFENTGAGAYLGAAPSILSKNYLADASAIALIEARHAGFLDVATNNPISISNTYLESALSAATVAKAVMPFVKSLNGGPPLTYSTTPSAANDIAILNFALALEFLEAEFYDINVSKFY